MTFSQQILENDCLRSRFLPSRVDFQEWAAGAIIVCYRLRLYYIRGKRKASRFDPICFSISGPTRCLQTAPVDEVPQCHLLQRKEY